MDNLKEFKELIEYYESITLYEINMAKLRTGYSYMSNIANFLTGFGAIYDCCLCKNIDVHGQDCDGCVYSENLGLKYSCNMSENKSTYQSILKSQTETQLFKAFKARAKHMRNIFKQLENE